MRRRRGPTGLGQDDLFSIDPSANVMHALEGAPWPAHEEFPFNRAGTKVRSVVRSDLAASPHPLIVAGYSSIAELVDFVAEWQDGRHDGVVRVVLGAEPYPSARYAFSSATAAFTDEVRRYWQDQGISLRLSAKVLQAIEAIDRGRLACRFVHGATTLHAKVYVGEAAATVGSSNFTAAGLGTQLEANARFERVSEPVR
ncbi:MAG: phospholipase D family protein [Acidimicrobiales bacterium]